MFVPKTSMRAGIIITSVITLVAVFGWMKFSDSIRRDLLITDVPYAGLYNHGWSSSAATAVYTVLQYWRQYDTTLPNPSLAELMQKWPLINDRRLFDEIAEYFRGFGYEVRFIRSENPARMAKYLNPKERTPLIFTQLIKPDYTGGHPPYRVAIGISNKRKIITVHDAFLGPAYSLSFKEWKANFPKNWPENAKYTFLVARPKNYKTIIAKRGQVVATYPDRAIYDRFQNIIVNWLEFGDFMGKSAEKKLWHMKNVYADQSFSELPIWLRVYTVNNMAALSNQVGNYTEAKILAEEAIGLNNGIDKPVGIWTFVYPKSQVPNPWKHLGDAYLGLGNKMKAKESYQMALSIDPNYQAAKEAFERAL